MYAAGYPTVVRDDTTWRVQCQISPTFITFYKSSEIADGDSTVALGIDRSNEIEKVYESLTAS